MRCIINTVIKIIGEIYSVLNDDGDILQSSIRNTVKKSRVVVGDHVDIVKNDYDNGKYIITNVHGRRNFIPRPPIANIDKLLIVIAAKPEPDLYLVDKLYIYCVINNIEPVLIINKCDLCTTEFIENIQKQYYFMKIFVVSAKNNINVNNLAEYIRNSFCALCGQSAVGKSSILNALIPSLSLQTQGLSAKIDRGKHTTRVNEVFTDNGLIIADTPGFTSLELDIEYKYLADYYPEFQIDEECRYLDCSHIKEGKDCAICARVDNGLINRDRYNRYVEHRNKLKEKWEKRYD